MPSVAEIASSAGPVQKSSITNGHAEGITHIVDPLTLTRPNLALWVTKDHRYVSRFELAK